MPQERYRVIEKLDSGGMAEVFRGEAESIQGFKKQVAIKRVLPHLAQNRKFIAMFLDEARISLHLNHANIVQVFDIGVAENTYFIVMEYVDGSTLKALLELKGQRGTLMPVEQAIYLMIEVCKALSYAHDLTDPEGRQLNIVHRDVSPPNVLISKRGEVKLVDFGLAKAVGQLENTDPGVVKGKFSYLSPEAATGQEVDARADIFAAGALLFEMVTGQRLFYGASDIETVELVRRANVPSITRLNPSAPRALEPIIMKALARDRTQRYSSAREFSDALSHLLFSHGMKVTAYDIASAITEVVSLRKQQQRARGEPSIIDRLIQDALLTFTSLDEMADPLDPGSRPLDPADIDGGRPLDGGAFEDPRGWAGELLGDDREAVPLVDRRGADQTWPEPSSGVQPMVEPQSGPTRPSVRPGLRPGELATALEGDTKQSAAVAPPKRSSSSNEALKIILGVLLFALLGVAGAIAYLLLQ